MSETIYNLKLLVDQIQRPYYPIHPSNPTGEINRNPKRWTLTEALAELQRTDIPEWRNCVINRLKRIEYRVPDYIQHPLVDLLVAEGALVRKKVQ